MSISSVFAATHAVTMKVLPIADFHPGNHKSIVCNVFHEARAHRAARLACPFGGGLRDSWGGLRRRRGRAARASAAEPLEPQLYGSWTVLAINGSAPLRLGAAYPAHPSLVFSPSRYGGSTGCNSFGGTGLLVGDRWFGESPIATQMGCGPLAAQERTIIGIAAGGPTVAFQGPGEVTLSTRAGSLRLRRDADAVAPQSEPESLLLAGTAWEVTTIDGRPLPEPIGPEARRLGFEADQWVLNGVCAPLAGKWRQAGQSVRMEVTSKTARDCGPVVKPLDDALRAMISAGPRYVTGPNRELVMAGGGHWLTGRFDRSLGRDDKAMLRGEWRIDAVDGVAPATGERPASLAFGNASYAVWDGCAHTEGVQLTFARQLFTRDSGMGTLALCPPDPLRGRISGIVASNPRYARTGSGGLALVSRAGTLRLTQLSSRGFGTGEQLGLRAPRTVTLLEPRGELTLLGGGRFAVALDCGRVEGDWRGGQPARFSPDPLERTAPNCPGGPGSDAFRVSQFFTGNVSAVTGPNRDILLLVNEDKSIAGQVAR